MSRNNAVIHLRPVEETTVAMLERAHPSYSLRFNTDRHRESVLLLSVCFLVQFVDVGLKKGFCTG